MMVKGVAISLIFFFRHFWGHSIYKSQIYSKETLYWELEEGRVGYYIDLEVLLESRQIMIKSSWIAWNLLDVVVQIVTRQCVKVWAGQYTSNILESKEV